MVLEKWFKREEHTSSSESSSGSPLIPRRGDFRRRSGCGLFRYVTESSKAFTSALNPRITFRKRNSFEDLRKEHSRTLTQEQVDALHRGTLKRSKTTVTPSGNRVFRQTPSQRGKKTQYLFRSLSDLGQERS